jgi:hypothetical protein
MRLTLCSFVSRTRQRAQDTVEYGLVVAGAALLAALAYTLFNPLIQDVANQVKISLSSMH